jgi:imidazoleglycerol-phosphate dehydratase / histidinol-phosphatase
MLKKYAFLDRDGTLIFEPKDSFQIDSIKKLKILPGVISGLKKLIKEGFTLIMITNQDGLGTKSFPQKDFEKPQQEMLKIFRKEGIEFEKIFICPHLEKDNCNCRKPKTGLVDELVNIDLENSFVCGDRESDKGFAKNLNLKFISPKKLFGRSAEIIRKTTETNINLELNLDGTGQYEISTGIGFLDHMLELFTKHSLIDLKIKAKGDLNVDEHHTIEDIGITLGQALKEALGNKKGIRRYGFLLPMDETLAELALDLGGRPYLVWNLKFKRERIGDMPTELFEDFFKAISDNLKANIHVNLKYGRNEHHMAEAIFKAFAKALRSAVDEDLRAKNLLPTTKGKL